MEESYPGSGFEAAGSSRSRLLAGFGTDPAGACRWGGEWRFTLPRFGPRSGGHGSPCVGLKTRTDPAGAWPRGLRFTLRWFRDLVLAPVKVLGEK